MPRDREQLLAGYAQLAASWAWLEMGRTRRQAAARVRHWLEAGGQRCLLVLDNADSADVLRPFFPPPGRRR